MKFILLSCVLMISGESASQDSSENFLRMMHERYKGKWYKTFTFEQTTEFYSDGMPKGKATWHEAVKFPDKFRIDFGDPVNEDAVIYRNDSVYRFSKGKLVSSGVDKNELTFLLGGLYFHPFEKVRDELLRQKFDLMKSHLSIWRGRPVVVIGANSGDTESNQIWFDQGNFYVVRLIRREENKIMEAVFENQIPLDGGWSETAISFYFDGKLSQREFYHHCKVNRELADDLFDPKKFGLNMK